MRNYGIIYFEVVFSSELQILQKYFKEMVYRLYSGNLVACILIKVNVPTLM